MRNYKIKETKVYKVNDRVFNSIEEANEYIANEKSNSVFEKISIVSNNSVSMFDDIVDLIGRLTQEEVNIVRRYVNKRN